MSSLTVTGSGPPPKGRDGEYKVRGKRAGKPWYVMSNEWRVPCRNFCIEFDHFQGGTWRLGPVRGLREEDWVKLTHPTCEFFARGADSVPPEKGWQGRGGNKLRVNASAKAKAKGAKRSAPRDAAINTDDVKKRKNGGTAPKKWSAVLKKLADSAVEAVEGMGGKLSVIQLKRQLQAVKHDPGDLKEALQGALDTGLLVKQGNSYVVPGYDADQAAELGEAEVAVQVRLWDTDTWVFDEKLMMRESSTIKDLKAMIGEMKKGSDGSIPYYFVQLALYEKKLGVGTELKDRTRIIDRLTGKIHDRIEGFCIF